MYTHLVMEWSAGWGVGFITSNSVLEYSGVNCNIFVKGRRLLRVWLWQRL